MNQPIFSPDQFAGCLIGGAIGDAYGGQYENSEASKDADEGLFVWGKLEAEREYFFSDDTQLTLASYEAIVTHGGVSPEAIGQNFVRWYQQGKLSGLGAATLQAIQGLANGGHWWLAGRKGEYAAGNGAAMRIAPLAFVEPEISRDMIRDVSRLTHHNDEAYAGSLAVFHAIRSFARKENRPAANMLQGIAAQLPDTLVKDRLISMADFVDQTSIAEIAAQFGTSAYVVESVPFAIFAAIKSRTIGFEAAIEAIIASGGDTDTNASMMGQIAGSELGLSGLPQNMLAIVSQLDGFVEIKSCLESWAKQ